MDSDASMVSPNRGRLIIRDSVIFLILCCVTMALFTLTLLLFRSFEQRREDLGRKWSKRGQIALQQGRPKNAVGALRTALSYEPNERADQLLLAQALAEAGRTEEANSYFLNLREASPGDGFVNLQLARLARKQGDAQEAVNYYRASIFGDWEGDGSIRRREVRLELSQYLVSRGDIPAARAELLIAVGNAPDDTPTDVMFGDRLQATGDLTDALQLYQKALAGDPHDAQVMVKAGRVAFKLGAYSDAYKLLTEAVEKGSRGSMDSKEREEISALAAQAHRIPQLRIFRDLPAAERAEHLVVAAGLAKKRLATCSAMVVSRSGASPASHNPLQPLPLPLESLDVRWEGIGKDLSARVLERDAELEDEAMQLIDDTETNTAAVCGAPAGDDAILLMLATSNHRGTP